MEISEQNQQQAPAAMMAPPALSSPNGDRLPDQYTSVQGDHQQQHPQSTNGGPAQPVGAAAAAQQPKVVQTAFIHKLYRSVSALT
jgi:hypothetical protein